MHQEPVISELDPIKYPNICLISQVNSRILYDERLELDPLKPIFDKKYWQRKSAITGSASGRGTTLFLHDQGQDWILRPYLRGGLPGKLLSNQFLFTGYNKTRAWREFLLLLDMIKMGLPVPEPVAAGITRRGLIYHNSTIIKRIPGARDLHNLLCNTAFEEEVWLDIGSTIRRFHDHQIYHHDLNIRNIMLDEMQTTWLIDFDKCGILKGNTWKQQNLARLLRSFNKERTKQEDKNQPFYWQDKHWQTLMQGYSRGKG